jgi:hypothetical protein
MKTILLAISILLIFSCSNQNSDNVKLNIESIELIIPKDSLKNRSAKLSSVQKYLEQNQNIDIVKNYNFLNQDTIFISPNRPYSKKLKNQLNLSTGQLTLFPISYKISKGPFAKFKIQNNQLGTLESYILNFSFSYNKVSNCEALIAFCKTDSLGKKQTTLFKTIRTKDKYSIEQNLKSKNWH